ncbi:helix-turn-helix domain-containing protein [Streptomyces sp. A3M-1-3]|uniref:helix-turn-helix domain-containing protein n=1 Tax=Streptomyces sp. A3M-1-3 TaxID=2962044 RepID=UPI0020B7E3E1|nr:helix-turn-helix domain-containing protein [Streptomyces sp. A3M-1-3]MCP3820690.1 helix-turn-helix domain-containing protein [Streptomyces sp. A3M-1-3]
MESPAVVAEREQIRLAHDLGQLVYDRRMALGLTSSELGQRLGMSADEVEAIELGGVLPVSSDLLARLAAALDVAVDLHVVPEGRNTVAFVARAA